MRFGHDLRRLEPNFSDNSNPDDQEELIGDFTTASEAITVVINVEDVINSTFLGPQIASRVFL